MAKSTSQRRFTKVVDELTDLRLNHPKRFRIMSRTYFRGWVQEVQRRAAAQRQDPVDEPTPATFGILKSARDLVRGISAEAELTVAESLIHLVHVCSQAAASVTNPKLYRIHADCTYRVRERFVCTR